MSKLQTDETILGLAASVTCRAHELIQDGWVKGRMSSGAGGAEKFCIHGAINLAMEEVFGRRDISQNIQRNVEDIAVAFICDEAFGRTKGHWSGGIPAAVFNDAAARRHDEVLGVLDRAGQRLWAITMDTDSTEKIVYPTQWAGVEETEAQQYLYASLA